MVSIKIDNVTVPIQKPFEFLIDGTEGYNISKIVLVNSTQATAYEDFADVEIILNSITYEFIINKDTVTRTAEGIYRHDILLQEPVFKLNEVPCPDRKFDTFQGVQVTKLYVLQQLLNYELDYTTPYTISSALQTKLNTPAEDKEYVGGNLLTNIIDLFRSEDIVPTLSLDNEIGFQDLNERGTLIDLSNEIARIIDSDTEDYAKAVTTKIKNASYEEDIDIGAIWFPSSTGYITPRSTNDKYEDDESTVEFNSIIRRVTEMYVLELEVFVTATNQGNFGSIAGDLPSNPSNGDQYVCDTQGYTSAESGITYNLNDTATWVFNEWITNIGGTGTQTAFIDVDFTEAITDRESFEKLLVSTNATEVTTGRFKNNTLYFDGNNIPNMGTKYRTSSIIENTTWYEMLEKFAADNVGLGIQTYPEIYDAKLRFKIVPQRDLTPRQIRQYSSRVLRNSIKQNQQKDSEIELGRFGKVQKQYVNRLGNDKFDITLRYTEDELNDIKAINDYDSEFYKVVKMKFNVYANLVDVTYSLVKNNSNLNPYEAFASPVSPYTIQGKEVFTDFPCNYYLEFSTTNRVDTAPFNSDFRKILFNAYNYSATYDTPIENVVYQSAESDVLYVGMTPQRAVMGTSFIFNAQFDNKTIAGKRIEATGFSGLWARKLMPINYTNGFGEVYSYQLYWSNLMSFTAEDYPEVNVPPKVIFQTGFRTVNLNPNEILSETDMIHCITDTENLIVYERFLKENSLVKKLLSGKSMVIYEFDNTRNFTINDTTVKEQPTGTGTVTFDANGNYFDVTVTSGKSWCIADTEGGSIVNRELHFAYNNRGTDVTRIYMNMLNDDPTVNTL